MDDGSPAAATHRVTVAGTGQSFEVRQGDRILAAARRAGVWFPFECGWGSCGTCKVTLVDGGTELLFPQAPCVDPRDARRGRIVVCQSTATSDVVLKSSTVQDHPVPDRATADHSARLASRQALGPDIARFVFALDAPAAYRPGQYAILELAPGLQRCYSMAGPPGSAEVSFIAKRYPDRPGSEQLFRLAVGEQLRLELPYGDMWVRDSPRPVVLVAGGTGISAILAMTRQLAAGEPPGRDVHVFFGAGTRAELVCWDELAQAMSGLPQGHLYGALLHPDADWEGTRGLVTTALGDQLPRLADADFYLAGPPVMTDAVRALLRAHDVQLDRVRYDAFG
jgi:toluene monooxygenase electron transfer component